jgi:hypothetical protein
MQLAKDIDREKLRALHSQSRQLSKLSLVQRTLTTTLKECVAAIDIHVRIHFKVLDLVEYFLNFEIFSLSVVDPRRC